jgi:hypothetical protein
MRKEQRKIVARSASIDLGDKGTVNCRIADMSRGGALLLVSDSEWLPKSFPLIDIFARMKRPVGVAWTASNRAGVRFLDASAEPDHTEFGRRRP